MAGLAPGPSVVRTASGHATEISGINGIKDHMSEASSPLPAGVLLVINRILIPTGVKCYSKVSRILNMFAQDSHPLLLNLTGT